LGRAGLWPGERALETFDGGLIVGIPLLLGTLVAFLPAEAVAGLPAVLRPVLANGFVVGIVTVLGLEHLVYGGGREERGEGDDRVPWSRFAVLCAGETADETG